MFLPFLLFVFVVLVALAVYDVTQRKHAILRNFPLWPLSIGWNHWPELSHHRHRQ